MTKEEFIGQLSQEWIRQGKILSWQNWLVEQLWLLHQSEEKERTNATVVS